jgi:hypothetical protein
LPMSAAQSRAPAVVPGVTLGVWPLTSNPQGDVWVSKPQTLKPQTLKVTPGITSKPRPQTLNPRP